ncbi:MAG: hypothetical protein ACI8R9_000384 [Paraglaciecola sp.]
MSQIFLRKLKSKLFFAGFFLFVTLNSLTTTAASEGQSAIPQALQDWIPWVLDGQEHLQCPFINQSVFATQYAHICAFPSALKLNVSSKQATFTVTWQVLEESWLVLPGNSENWPQEVMANGKTAQVLNYKERPALHFKRGTYKIDGKFLWDTMPSTLAVSEVYAQVELSKESQAVRFAKRRGEALWLNEQNEQNEQADTLDLVVKRKVQDGSYVFVETLIELDVSGRIREEKLGLVLPPGFLLGDIRGDLPAFVDASGTLIVTVRPGNWQLSVYAYAGADTLVWQRPERQDLWPEQEMWAFASAEKYRTGKLTGAQMIDANIAGMPQQWNHLPTYVLNATDKLAYAVSHRGKPLQLENKLYLKRDLWLSFDSLEFTFSDQLTGSMIDHWRLSMRAPYLLQSADDQDGSMLITSLDNDERGIENRYPQVDIRARGKLASGNDLLVAAWEENFESVTTHLNLPPGHSLFAAFGADKVSSSWLSNWSIWGSFVVLASAIFAARVINPICGILSALLLLALYQEPGAPIVLIVNLLIAVGIVKYQPFPKLLPLVKTYFTVSLLTAIVAILYFSAKQVRTVIYPQLEVRNYNVQQYENAHYDISSVTRAAPEPMAVKMFRSAQENNIMQDEPKMDTVSGNRIRQADTFKERYESDAVVQAGEGIPSWNWQQYVLSWNSPVTATQGLDLWILDRLTYSMIKVLGVIIAMLWLFYLWRSQGPGLLNLLGLKKTVPVVFALLLLPTYSPTGMANTFPDQALLKELQERLIEAPACAPQCASLTSIHILAKPEHFTFQANYDAAYDTAVALPRSEFWRPQRVTLNGKPQTLLAARKGWIFIAIPAGSNKLILEGPIVPVDSLQIQFRNPAKFVTLADSSDWKVSGLKGSTMLDDRLTFSATAQKKQSTNSISSRYESAHFVEVNRSISLDQNWRINTEVRRISPSLGAINVRIPLLTGENVITAGIEPKDAFVEVTIGQGQSQVLWESTLDKQQNLKLTSSSQGQWIEHWQLVSSPSWHFKSSGLPMILHEQANDDYFSYSFYPYSGETLSLTVSRPPGVEGNVIAIDKLNATLQQGERTSTFLLSFNYRSTRGGEHLIDLPDDYELKEVKSDDNLLNVQAIEQRLALPILPGLHRVQLSLRYAGEATSLLSLPRVNLNAPVSNIETKISISNNRWIIWAKGPVLGPAVVYWGELLVFILIALLLSKVNFSPLKTWQWLLLGFGLSLNNWHALILIALWFAALTGSRYRGNIKESAVFNFTQLALYFLSAVTLLTIITTIPDSLLSNPDMGIQGNRSYGNELMWFADKSMGGLPEISVLSVPILIYKGLMLLWVMWLSFSLLNWIKWAWPLLGAQGYWRTGKGKKSSPKSQGDSPQDVNPQGQ